jgi:hypothetical protein
VDRPRTFKAQIKAIAGLTICDRDCGCGERNGLVWTTGIGKPDWIPGWMNGATPEEVWDALVEMGRIKPRRLRLSAT